MKKFISLIVIICIIINIMAFTFVNASASEIITKAPLKKDFPCYKIFDIMTFNQDNLQADLSNGAELCTYDQNSSLRFHMGERNDSYKMVYKAEKGEFFDDAVIFETIYNGNIGVDIDFVSDRFSGIVETSINVKFRFIDKNNSTFDYSAYLYANNTTKLYFDLNVVQDAEFVEIIVENNEIYKNSNVVISPIEIFYSETEHNIIQKGYKKPTCSNSGSSGREYCTVCGEYFTIGYALGPIPHNEITDKPIKATCDKTGLSEGKHCSLCGKIIKKQQVLPAIGHKFKWVITKKATYFNKGKKAYKCIMCNKISKIKSINKLKLKIPKVELKYKGKKLIIKYKKSADATGFQIKYTIGKNTFIKSFKTTKSAIKSITGLKKGAYKIRTRSFIQSKNKKAYSNWSNLKKIKI